MFESTFLQTAYVSRPIGTLDQYGQPSGYQVPVPFACRYQPSDRMVNTSDRRDVVASAVLFTMETITPADLVFPPGADQGDPDQGRHPLRVDPHYELLSGDLSHYTVTI